MRSTIVSLLVVAGCSGAGGDSASVTVNDAWGRNDPMVTDVGAAYLLITSTRDDAIVGASVERSVAARAELHDTIVAADGSSSTNMVDRIALPAGRTVELRPGGLLVKLTGLTGALPAGGTITVTLSLESGGELDVPVPIREDGE